MLYAWIYRENNTRDPCEHRKDQPAHHSKKGLMPPCGWRHYTQARSCLGRVDPGPEPSLSQAGNEGPAWRREEAPSRASPAGNQLTRQKGKPQPQGEESPNRSSPRKLFLAGEGHPPTRRRRAGLSRNVAFQRKPPPHGVQRSADHQKAVGAVGNQTHLTGCVTTSQTPYEQQKMPEIRFSPSFLPFTAP